MLYVFFSEISNSQNQEYELKMKNKKKNNIENLNRYDK